MLAFAVAVLFLIITPGPGVLSTAGVGAAYGSRPALAYVAGLWAGNNLVALIVISGLAAAALAVPWLRLALVIASTAYLLYLAAKIALAGSKLGFINPPTPPGFWNGLALQPINPKAYAVNAAFFSGFPIAGMAPTGEIAVKFAIMNAIWIPIHLAWMWAGIALRQLNLPDGWTRAINYAMAGAMLVVVGLAVYAQLAGGV